MNQTLIKNVSLLAAGAVVGGITGYLVAKLIIRNQVEQEEPKYEWLPEVKEPKGEVKSAEVIEGKNGAKIMIKKGAHDYGIHSKEKGDLNKLVEQYTTQIKKVRIVSESEVVEATGRPFEQIIYYEGDNTFCDIEEKLIDDPHSKFVPNVYLHFGEQSSDPDIVYVRNDNLGVDFEITRVHNKYSVVVLGEPEQPKKATRRVRKTAGKAENNVVEANEDDEQ